MVSSASSVKDARYMELAVREAYKSEMYTRHGCIIVVNGKIIGRGHNNYRTVFADGFVQGSCSCHAEMDALRNAFKEKKCIAKAKQDRYSKVANPNIKNLKINIYVACVMPNGSFHNSSPCVDCFENFKHILHTIKYLVYTKKGVNRKSEYLIEKIHFRDYIPSLETSGRLYKQSLVHKK
jgi:pyrimidine deaminase RibD-like protein